jgi:hypothetical protein
MRPYLEKTHHKKGAGGVTQGEGPEFKPQYCKKKKKVQALKATIKSLQSPSHLHSYNHQQFFTRIE